MQQAIRIETLGDLAAHGYGLNAMCDRIDSASLAHRMFAAPPRGRMAVITFLTGTDRI